MILAVCLAEGNLGKAIKLQCFLMGAYHTGSCFWFTTGGAVLWTALARVAGGLCTLVWGLLSPRVGTVSVALPVVVAQEPSQCGRPPRVAFSLP